MASVSVARVMAARWKTIGACEFDGELTELDPSLTYHGPARRSQEREHVWAVTAFDVGAYLGGPLPEAEIWPDAV